jgi:hypothetical protein
MLEPANSGARNLKALLDSKIDGAVGDDDVPTLCNADIAQGIVENP